MTIEEILQTMREQKSRADKRKHAGKPWDLPKGKMVKPEVVMARQEYLDTTDKAILDRQKDAISPEHYKSHPSGIECIAVTEHLNFCLGNVIKYVWRYGQKGYGAEDLKKARWYLDREISRLEKSK